MTAKGIYGIFFDVETTGPYTQCNAITEIAFVLKNLTTGEVEDMFTCFLKPVEGSAWDQACYEGFWKTRADRYQRTLEGIQSQHLDNQVVMHHLWNWLTTHAETKDCTLFSDNALGDGAWINTYLPPPCHLTLFTGSYRPIVDLRYYYLGIARCQPHVDYKGAVLKAGLALGFQVEEKGTQLLLPDCLDIYGNVVHYSHIPSDDALVQGHVYFIFSRKMHELTKQG